MRCPQRVETFGALQEKVMKQMKRSERSRKINPRIASTPLDSHEWKPRAARNSDNDNVSVRIFPHCS